MTDQTGAAATLASAGAMAGIPLILGGLADVMVGLVRREHSVAQSA